MSAIPYFEPVRIILDSLAADKGLDPRLAERYRRMAAKPQTILIRTGYDHPCDDSLVDWGDPIPTSRDAAADVLRTARLSKLRIERRPGGYSISGGTNPAWRYRNGS